MLVDCALYVSIASVVSIVGRWMNRSSCGSYRAAFDASCAKLVSLVAYRDSRRSENQRILHDVFQCLARFVFLNAVPASLAVWGALGIGLGTSTAKR